MNGLYSDSISDSLGQALLSLGKITKDDLRQAVDLQKKAKIPFQLALLKIGALSEDSLLEELKVQYDLPIISEDEFPEIQVVHKFMSSSELNFDWFFSKEVVLWEFGRDELGFIAKEIFDPSIEEILLRFFSKKKLRRFLSSSLTHQKLLEDLKKEHDVDSLFHDEESRQLRELAEEAPVVEFVNNLIAQAVDINASDIHIEPEEREFRVRFRVDGVLQDRLSQPISRYAAVASRIKLVSGLDISERRLPQDGRMSTRTSGVEMDVRVSSAPCVHGESVVLRLLPKERDEVGLTKIGMEQDHLQLMSRWARLSSGIVLVTGPTGSGKSTTLHAALSQSNDGERKIITVEDPVEIRVPNITQIQTHEDIGYTFANALRAILRQDPDVIMIGEIRDLETAEIAIQAALSGHLVLSTLHTNDALSAFTRLIDMGVEPFLAAAPVKGLQAQRLVRLLCSHCAETSSAPLNMPEELRTFSSKISQPNWKKAVGCELCNFTGFSGRSGIYELIEVDANIQDLVAKGCTLNEIRKLVSDFGFRTLLQDGLLKVSKGETTLDEVLRVVNQEGGV